MKYGLFLGCNTPAIRPDVEQAIRMSMEKIDVELVDMEGYVCCPAFGTFPSSDEEGHLLVSAWNLSIAEEKKVDLLIECGSCYSSLRLGNHLLQNDSTREKINKKLKKSKKLYNGGVKPRHMMDILYNSIGVEKIRSSIKKNLNGMKCVVQYPCHTMYPGEIVGFEDSSRRRPYVLKELVEALGGEVVPYSKELQCCGGAGGFHGSSAAEAQEFVKGKYDAIIAETEAEFIVVSCITCLMFLDNEQKKLNNGEDRYTLPVFDYNQLLALCLGCPPEKVASISTISRDRVIKKILNK